MAGWSSHWSGNMAGVGYRCVIETVAFGVLVPFAIVAMAAPFLAWWALKRITSTSNQKRRQSEDSDSDSDFEWTVLGAR